MPTPRAFDYDKLKELVFEHPDWSYRDYLAALNADNAANGRPPAAEGDVKRVISRHRAEWEAETGVEIKPRVIERHASSPPPGTLDPQYQRATVMRYQRSLDGRDLGDVPEPGSTSAELRSVALSWERRMRSDLTIVDLTSKGEPIVRAARPEEINSLGELITLYAWLMPDWRKVRRHAA